MSFETEPFEETRLRSGSRDERRDEFPTLPNVMNISNSDIISFAMFANDPYKNLEITNTPVPFEFTSFSHP